ncbi:MAG: hypothetical protein ACJ75J_16265, partial [Cytophagaceae bacterium]
NDILHAGIIHDISHLDKRYLRIGNFINLLLIFLISIPATVAIMILTNDGLPSYIRFLLLIICSATSILLNHYHHHFCSKVLTVAAPFILIFLFPLFNGFLAEGMFLWFPYGIMVIGGISFFIFSYEKERWMLNLSVLFFAFSALFYDMILRNFAGPEIDLTFIYGRNAPYFYVSKTLVLVFLYSSFYKFKIAYHKSCMELLKANEKLDFINLELKKMNISLEDLAKAKTEKLDLQNNRIKDLAFVNSHKIRSSVARIIGLINVANHEVTSDEKEYCYLKVRETSLELDDVTRRLSLELVEE